MAIKRGYQPTDIDKRLKILRQQVYGGGNKGTGYKLPVTGEIKVQQDTTQTDLNFLKQDLIKISVLATSAIILQFLIYFALKNGFLKIPI